MMLKGMCLNSTLAPTASPCRNCDAAPLSYATLAERARARGEVAIGVQRGDDLELNPRARRQKSLRLGPEDKLVVLGQCF